MPYKYIGRTTTFNGKTLWELVGNLKNFGVDRIVARSAFERYPEPSFFKIVKVETLPNPQKPTIDDVRKVKVWVERTFRARKSPNLVCLESASYKSDYKLIPKDQEAEYCSFKGVVPETKILPRTISFPPLMRDIIMTEMKQNGGPITEPQLDAVYLDRKRNSYRSAEDGENPNVEQLLPGVGKPITPRLYKNVKL